MDRVPRRLRQIRGRAGRRGGQGQADPGRAGRGGAEPGAAAPLVPDDPGPGCVRRPQRRCGRAAAQGVRRGPGSLRRAGLPGAGTTVSQAPAPAAAAGARQLAPLYAAGFVTAFGAHAVAANLGRYALARHGSLWELSLLLGIYDGAEVVLKPVFGALADRTGTKPVMAGGLVVFAAASAAFVIGGDPHLLGAARFAQGAGAAAFSPAAAATVAALGGQKRSGRLFGGYGGAKGIGYLLGPVAGGALVAAGGYPALFGVLAVIAIAAALAVAALVPASSPLPGRVRRCPTWPASSPAPPSCDRCCCSPPPPRRCRPVLASCPCWQDCATSGPSPPAPWYPCSPRPPRCCSPSPAGGSTMAALARARPPPRWPRARVGFSSR